MIKVILCIVLILSIFINCVSWALAMEHGGELKELSVLLDKSISNTKKSCNNFHTSESP